MNNVAFTDEELATLSAGLKVLHDHFPVDEWTIKVGPTMFKPKPEDFTPFRSIYINNHKITARVQVNA